jgi:2-oxoglutarate ferredoxin oxidoreductase subunit alpha
VFVASDLDIGMNDWMVPRLTWDDSYRPDRGKLLSSAELEGIQRFSRYLDVDGDGIAARTIPGVHPKGAYFTRGSGHNKHGAYTEDGAEYQEVMDRLARKLATAASAVPAPEIRAASPANGTAPLGLISLGGCHAAVREAVDRLGAQGIACDYMRIRAFPFHETVDAFLRSHDQVLVVEQNRDGQLRSLLAIETGFARERMTSVLDYEGLPLTADFVVAAVSEHLAGAAV